MRETSVVTAVESRILDVRFRSVVRHSIVHKALVDYLLNSTAEARAVSSIV